MSANKIIVWLNATNSMIHEIFASVFTSTTNALIERKSVIGIGNTHHTNTYIGIEHHQRSIDGTPARLLRDKMRQK